MYIKVAHTARFIIEKKFAILIELLSGNVFLINDAEKIEILSSLMDGCSKENIIKEYGDKADKYITELYDARLIIFTESMNNFKDSFDYGGKALRYMNEMSIGYDLKELIIEVGNECNLSCINCNSFREFECEKCFRNENKYEKEINIEELLQLIDKILYFGCNGIRFVGGNPLLNLTKITKVLDFVKSRDKDIQCVIVTNGLNILTDESIVRYIQKYNIILSIQMIDNSNDYIELIRYLKEKEIKFYVVSNGISREYFPSDINVLNNRQLSDIALKGDGELINQNNFINIPTFNEESEGRCTNDCMYKKLYIDINGEYYPCLGSKLKLGNIDNEKYGEIYKKADSVWKNTNLYMIKCNNCEAKPYCNSCLISKAKILESTEFCKLTKLSVI